MDEEEIPEENLQINGQERDDLLNRILLNIMGTMRWLVNIFSM